MTSLQKSKKMKKRNVLAITIAWAIFIYIGYNVLTVEASSQYDDDYMKSLCEEGYNAKWKDDGSGCNFSKESTKIDEQGAYEHDLEEEGLYDDYYKKTTSKEDRDKIEKENQKYLAEEEIAKTVKDLDSEPWTNYPTNQVPLEDLQNTVTTTADEAEFDEEDLPEQDNAKSEDNEEEEEEDNSDDEEEEDDDSSGEEDSNDSEDSGSEE